MTMETNVILNIARSMVRSYEENPARVAMAVEPLRAEGDGGVAAAAAPAASKGPQGGCFKCAGNHFISKCPCLMGATPGATISRESSEVRTRPRHTSFRGWHQGEHPNMAVAAEDQEEPLHMVGDAAGGLYQQQPYQDPYDYQGEQVHWEAPQLLGNRLGLLPAQSVAHNDHFY